MLDVCTFVYIVKHHQLTDPAILKRARIIRGADTDRLNLAPQAAGLWAIAAGPSHHLLDDHQVLETGLKVYDALYFGPGMYKMKSTAGIRFRLPARPDADVKRWQPDYWAATFNKLSGLL